MDKTKRRVEVPKMESEVAKDPMYGMPDDKFSEENSVIPETAVCSRCRSIIENKAQFTVAVLKQIDVVCSSCLRKEYGDFEELYPIDRHF